MDGSRCDASSQRAAPGRFVFEVSQLVALATLLRPRGAERVEYEGIPYSQRGGIHNNLVGIENLWVERKAPGLVANGTATVLTRGLGTVTVAVKPRGWSLVRHKVNQEMTKAATLILHRTVNELLKSFIDVLRLNTPAIYSPSAGSCSHLWQPKCSTPSWRIVNWGMTSG
jgi:hypothetical protein